MNSQPDDLQCKGDIDRLDPIGNLARFALSTQGSYSAAIRWLERDIERTTGKNAAMHITDKKQAIEWLAYEKRRTGDA